MNGCYRGPPARAWRPRTRPAPGGHRVTRVDPPPDRCSRCNLRRRAQVCRRERLLRRPLCGMRQPHDMTRVAELVADLCHRNTAPPLNQLSTHAGKERFVGSSELCSVVQEEAVAQRQTLLWLACTRVSRYSDWQIGSVATPIPR